MAARTRRAPPRAPVQDDDERVYGLRAALAAIEQRPDDVLRFAYSGEHAPVLAELVAWAAEHDIPTRELDDDALAEFSGSNHHEGLCVATRPRAWATPKELGAFLLAGPRCAVALDRVRNPYNVGAILRTCAFFGLEAVLFGPMAPEPSLAPNAVRVAEGGAEHLLLARTMDLGESLGRLRRSGIAVLGADGESSTSALGYTFPERAVLVLGNEREGLSPHVRAQCDAVLAIPGSGAVESLNVSVAASVLVAELVRPRLLAPARRVFSR
ncbi:MAG: RNA methyltransferase [Kofleriaceae bacterium]|nr:RNA methyltransferase [Kofleriaceae bacterium]